MMNARIAMSVKAIPAASSVMRTGNSSSSIASPSMSIALALAAITQSAPPMIMGPTQIGVKTRAQNRPRCRTTAEMIASVPIPTSPTPAGIAMST
jgi:hypothetical protein